MRSIPVLRVEVQILFLAVLKETRQADSVVCKMRFLSDDYYIVFPSFGIQLEQFLTITRVSVVYRLSRVLLA